MMNTFLVGFFLLGAMVIICALTGLGLYLGMCLIGMVPEE